LSHTILMEFEITDKGALLTAVAAIGLRYNDGQRTFRGYGDSRQDCQDAISVPDNREAFEIGVIANSKGGYDLLWDNFGGGKDYNSSGKGLCDYVGQDGKRLYDEYNAAFLTKQYEQDGYSMSRTNTEDGRILLEAYR
jgi:hypothetical protein